MSRDRGSAAVEFIWLSLLLLVPLMYIVLAVFEVQRASYGVAAASRAAARAFVLTTDPIEADVRAHGAAAVALADHDVEGGVVQVRCDDCRRPGAAVTVEVTAEQPLPFLPTVLGEHLGAITVSGVHVEPWGRYRAAP